MQDFTKEHSIRWLRCMRFRTTSAAASQSDLGIKLMRKLAPYAFLCKLQPCSHRRNGRQGNNQQICTANQFGPSAFTLTTFSYGILQDWRKATVR